MAAKKKSAARKTAAKRVGAPAAKLPGVDAVSFLEELNGGPLTLGQLLQSIREGEEWTLSEMGQKLGVSRAHVHDVESGKRAVSVERAAAWAMVLGYHPGQFVQLALQAQVDAVSGLEQLRVSVVAAANENRHARARTSRS